jgi:hypothetical protein
MGPNLGDDDWRFLFTVDDIILFKGRTGQTCNGKAVIVLLEEGTSNVCLVALDHSMGSKFFCDSSKSLGVCTPNDLVQKSNHFVSTVRFL